MANEKCTECKRVLVLDEENLCAWCELNKGKTDDTTPSVVCGVCTVIVEDDSQGLVCDVCNTWFHNSCNVTPLNLELYELLNEAPNNVKWFCDKCIWETEKWIEEVNNARNKKARDVIDYKKIIDRLHKPVEPIATVQENEANNEDNSEVNEEVTQDEPVSPEECPENVGNGIALPTPEIKVEAEYEDREDYDYDVAYDSYDSDDWMPAEKIQKKRDPKPKEKKDPILKEKKEKKKDPIKRIKRKSTENTASDETVTSEVVVPENLSNILNFNPENLSNLLEGIISVKRKKTTKHMRAKCNLCPKAFLHLEDCIAHKLRDHEGIKKPYKCTVCDYGFDSKRHRERHMIKHSTSRNFTCDICGQAMKSNESLRKHISALHTDEKPLSCKDCDFKAKYRNTITSHMISEHGLETPYKCEQCNRYFIANSILKSHMYSHSALKPFPCDLCKKKFKTEKRKEAHMLTHTQEKTFGCTLCEKKFATQKLLNSHLLYHTPIEERPHGCDECTMRFTTISNLRLHKERHSGVMNSICDVCGRSFRTAHDLKRHAIIHTDERPHKCDICGKTFAHAGNLAVHIKFHKKIIVARCPICGYGAVSKYIITNHIREVHTNETPYECDICGSKYKTKGNLSKHKRGIRGSCKGFNTSDSSIQVKRKPKVVQQREYFEIEENKVEENSPISFHESSNSNMSTISTTQISGISQIQMPTMQTHVNQPSLFLYANTHNSNVFTTQYHNSIIPQNPRGIIATIQNSPGSY